jgi:hypothetical protein
VLTNIPDEYIKIIKVCNFLLQNNFTGGKPPEGGTKWKTRPYLMRRRNLLVH